MTPPTDRRENLVDLTDIVSNPLITAVKKPVSRFLGIDRINQGYAKACQDYGNSGLEQNFFQIMCEQFGIDYEVDEKRFAQIPSTGPVVVLSNHPLGLADGLLMGKLLTSIRQDAKVVANEQLNICPEIQPWLISVDTEASAESKKANMKATRKMLALLRGGGMLGVFPAGSASSFSIQNRCVTDDEWNENIATLIRKTGATVVTVHFSGRNSLFFQGVSLLRREARMALIPRELKRSVNQRLKLSIGKPIAAGQLRRFATDREMIDHLRVMTYCHGRKNKKTPLSSLALSKFSKSTKPRKMQTVIAPRSVESMEAEIAALPTEAKLVESGDYEVYVAKAKQLPEILVEIGRLREITFRGVGEGSGNECDLDTFDAYHLQLFMWDKVNRRIVGGYRIARVDEVIEQYGISGIYNSQFFSFKKKVIERMSQGLEMGRSFIIPEYQKKPLILGLIWQGIGKYVSLNPQYRYLFGVVSTSAEYNPLSFKLIVDFLKNNAMDQEMAARIKAKNPPKGKALKNSELELLRKIDLNEQDLSNMISQLEDDKKGIPVLLRQYLKLNGKILGFNIDKEFGGVLDCLIMVDIHKSPQRSLQRYFGKEVVEKIAKEANLG